MKALTIVNHTLTVCGWKKQQKNAKGRRYRYVHLLPLFPKCLCI